MSDWLTDFVRESNLIEGIRRDPNTKELNTTRRFLAADELTVDLLRDAALIFTDGYGKLRDRPGMDVHVGLHVAMRGGPGVPAMLRPLLMRVNEGAGSPFENHCDFETLHPFLDGNGRTGRLVWLWEMEHGHGGRTWTVAVKPWRFFGFLRSFYYQSLQESRP